MGSKIKSNASSIVIELAKIVGISLLTVAILLPLYLKALEWFASHWGYTLH